MIRHNLKLAVRTVAHHAGYVGLNVVGLALGLAACLMIGLFVRDELSYDRFHSNADRIVSVSAEVQISGMAGEMRVDIDLPAAAGPFLTDNRPEVDAFVRVQRVPDQTVSVADAQFEGRGFISADANFFDVFSFEVLRGDATEALSRPNTALITPGLAQRYFGNEDPIGRILHLESGDRDVEVGGLIAPPPSNSVLQFQAVLSRSDAPVETWSFRSSDAYLLLRRAGDVEALEAALPDIYVEQIRGINEARVDVVPLTRLYLNSDDIPGAATVNEGLLRGKVEYIYAFSIAAVLILLVACVNYVNLATARAAERSREVGVRKALGARRSQLVRQFLGESALLTVLSLMLACVAIEILLPHFNAITDKSLKADYFGDPIVPLLFTGVGLFVTALAGLYPAAVLASFEPIHVLRQAPTGSRSAAWMRRVLVTFQFAVSAGLILTAVVMQRQLHFVHEKDLGFESEQLVQLGSISGDRYPAYKRALLSVRGVQKVSIGPNLPGGNQGLFTFSEESPMRPDNRPFLPWFETDSDLLETMEIALVAGRFFDPMRPVDSYPSLVLNEAGARTFGWDAEEAIGRAIDRGYGRAFPVIGVVEDFHVQSLRQEIAPLAFLLLSDSLQNRGNVLARVAPERLSETLATIRDQHAAFFPDRPFSYTFLDEAFAAFYDSEKRLQALVSAFSVLALIVGALGVLGLVAHTAQRRTKEIGIRKVLGATEENIVALLSKELLVLVLVGFAIASPLAHVGINRWLNEFAYRINPGPGLYLSVGVALLLVALLVAGSQALRAAQTNPADALRYE